MRKAKYLLRLVDRNGSPHEALVYDKGSTPGTDWSDPHDVMLFAVAELRRRQPHGRDPGWMALVARADRPTEWVLRLTAGDPPTAMGREEFGAVEPEAQRHLERRFADRAS